MYTHKDSDELDDRTAESLLSGRYHGGRADLEALASFVADLRSAQAATPPAVVRPELVAIFEQGLPAHDIEAPAVVGRGSVNPPRKGRMLTTLSTFLATVTGKVVLGTAVVAVGATSAQATGVVDIPGLPDSVPAVENVEVPADNGADAEGSKPDGAGVDGSEVSDRATDGEPQEDGRAFGEDVAEDATEGTPAQNRPEVCAQAPDIDPQEGDVSDDAKEIGTEVADDCGEAGQDTQPVTPELPEAVDDAADGKTENVPEDPTGDAGDDAAEDAGDAAEDGGENAEEKMPEDTGRP